MHDAIIGERLGLPSVGVLTTQFVSAGELMARVLGAEDYEFASIPHPISSATDNELAILAKQTANACVDILISK